MNHARFGGGEPTPRRARRPPTWPGFSATLVVARKRIPDRTGKTHHAARTPLGLIICREQGDHKGPLEIVFFTSAQTRPLSPVDEAAIPSDGLGERLLLQARSDDAVR